MLARARASRRTLTYTPIFIFHHKVCPLLTQPSAPSAPSAIATPNSCWSSTRWVYTSYTASTWKPCASQPPNYILLHPFDSSPQCRSATSSAHRSDETVVAILCRLRSTHSRFSRRKRSGELLATTMSYTSTLRTTLTCLKTRQATMLLYSRAGKLGLLRMRALIAMRLYQATPAQCQWKPRPKYTMSNSTHSSL